jgi:hypothetical protein
MEELDLTEEQRKQLRDLEDEVRARLEKILTKEQRDKLEALAPPKDKGFPKKDKKDDDRPKKDDSPTAAVDKEGVSWFANWQDGLNEAKRTNRPILLVSAAPHCAGVSGTW